MNKKTTFLSVLSTLGISIGNTDASGSSSKYDSRINRIK